MVMINVSICCGDQTPSWLPSSPKGEIVGNMMQCVVLDEDILDGNILDEFPLNSNLCINNVNMMYL